MDKKIKLLEAALPMFVEDGFHGTSTGKIAQQAGVATGTLFNYFKTKDDLVLALYVHLKDELADYIRAHAFQGSGLRDMMKAQFLASLFWAVDNPLKFRFIQQFHTSPYASLLDQAVIAEQSQPHLSLIKQGIAAGILQDMPADLIYALISSQTFGLYQYIISQDVSSARQHQLIEQTFDLLWKMIACA